MAEKRFYLLSEAAEKLGISEDALMEMVTSGKLRGFRDGGTYKFKLDDIDGMVGNVGGEKAIDADEGDSGFSGSLMEAAGLDDDDLVAIDDDEEEDDLIAVDDDELVAVEDEEKPAAAGDSTVDLADEPEHDDDDLVLGNDSGTGSGISLGGDSGISLVDQGDSGFLLEETLDLGGSGADALVLGEDEDLDLADDGEDEAPIDLTGDDDFLLTPTDDLDDLDESESGSQVISLDLDGDDDAATMIGGGGMFEEDGFETLDGTPADAIIPGAPVPAGAEMIDPKELEALRMADFPEKPYSVGTLIGLALCVIPLVFCGMFAIDLLRNMWSWDGPYPLNSDMMETVLSWFD